MPSASRPLPLDRIVAPFADLVLLADLPDLPSDRRGEAVRFVTRRANAVPSFTRFGLTCIAICFRGLMALPCGSAAARLVASRSLPLVGEYPRLVRSLAFAFVWERWPDTLPRGGPG